MNALTSHAVPKIARLVAMLGTDHDDEALAAVRALGRTLDSVGHDFNDLANVIEAGAPPPRVDHPSVNAMLEELLVADTLSSWERSFCSELAKAIYRGAGLSAAQREKFAEIYGQRIGGGPCS